MTKKFTTLRLKGSNPKTIPYISFGSFVTVVDAYSLKECPTIVEIGAYQGAFTEIMSKRSPSSRILAVEADERTFHILAENTEKLTNVETMQSLIGTENKVVQFNLANANGTNTSPSTLSDKLHSSVQGFEINYVPQNIMSCTLSKFCDSHDISSIELLIMDVTRAELDILRSSSKMISRTNWIMMRVYNRNKLMAVEGSPLLTDYIKLLAPYGFELEFIVHRGKFFAFRRTN